MSPTLLSRRLKQLEAEGVVEHRPSVGGKSWTYHLTAAGREFAPLAEALGAWGQRWSVANSGLQPGHHDLHRTRRPRPGAGDRRRQARGDRRGEGTARAARRADPDGDRAD
jgi:hypothetical protein